MKSKIDELKLGVLLSYISIAIGNIIQISYTPIMLRLLGTSEYGLNNLASSIIGYLGLLSFGFGSSYMRYYSRYKVRDDEESIAILNGTYLIVYSVISIIVTIAGIILVKNIQFIMGGKLSYSELNILKILMILMIINMVISLPGSIFNSYLTANEKFAFQRWMDILKKLLNPFLTLPLLLIGFKSIAITSINVILTIVILIINIIYCYKYLRFKVLFKNLDLKLIIDMGFFSFFIFLNMIVDQINFSIDNFILGKYVGASSIAVYSIGTQLSGYFMTFSNTISSVFITRVNIIVASGKDERNQLNNLFIKVGRIQLIILAYVFFLFIFVGKFFVKIWAGVDYGISYYIALLLMASIIIDLIQNLGIKIVEAKNKHQIRAIIFLGIAILNLFISIPLAKKYGEIGAAIGTAISLFLGNGLIMNIYYKKVVNIDIYSFWKNIFKFIPSIAIIGLSGIIISRIILVDTIFKFINFIVIFTFIYIGVTWKLSMNQYEKELVKSIFSKFNNICKNMSGFSIK
ncbi:lipopolysaccharide biosynthesis protein [Clostridium tertium]